MTITIKPEQLAGALRKQAERFTKAVPVAAYRAGQRLKRHLQEQSDELGITDQGLWKAGWRVRKLANKNVVVENVAPHAGIVELGARPHKVGKSGREAIAKWAQRKLGLSKSESESASWAIAKKIEKEGVKGRHVSAKALPLATKWFAEEFKAVVAKEKR